jgi:hypothetical protein
MMVGCCWKMMMLLMEDVDDVDLQLKIDEITCANEVTGNVHLLLERY